ncbi:MAG: glycosyltransferase family 2 protein [Bacteroidota bacterium]|nr:glycosyltransferase family 2 protein [Bacteroidota bacterium]
MLSVVIPVYNSESTLSELYNRLQPILLNVKEESEIIFVDDASRDNSWKVLEELHKQDTRVKIIQLMRNFGQHNAIMCGFHYAQGEYVITMDDDLQNPPEEIPKLIRKIDEGYDLVYGEYITKHHGGIRNLGSGIIQFIYKKVFKMHSNITAFRIIRKKLVECVIKHDRSYVFLDGLLAWNTINIGTIPVMHNARISGKSGYGFSKLLTLAMNMITNFSILPLQFATWFGFSFAIIGFILAVYFLFKKIFLGIPVEGFTALIVAVTIFSGMQLITVGLIGEYLGRIHININAKPQYEIREIIE